MAELGDANSRQRPKTAGRTRTKHVIPGKDNAEDSQQTTKIVELENESEICLRALIREGILGE